MKKYSKKKNFNNIDDDKSEYDENDDIIDISQIPDYNEINFLVKERYYFKIIDKYYKKLPLKKVIMMIEIIEAKSNISLRLLDWFIITYAPKNKISYDIELEGNDNFDKKLEKKFNVHISYKAQLKSYTKKYFDPFRRRTKFKYYFGKDKSKMLCTTIGQLNFFKWAFTNNVIDYVQNNYDALSYSMIIYNKENKKKKVNPDVVCVDKNGVKIKAKKKKMEPGVMGIILSFD